MSRSSSPVGTSPHPSIGARRQAFHAARAGAAASPIHGEAATRSGLSAKTIRCDGSTGLIPTAPRSASGYRADGPDDVRASQLLRRSRALGFSMTRCRTPLPLLRDEGRAGARMRTLAVAHTQEIKQKNAELNDLRSTLGVLIGACRGDGGPECPILESLAPPPPERRGARPTPTRRRAHDSISARQQP